MAKTATTIFPPDGARDELAIVVIDGTVRVQLCTVAMAGGEVPTSASPWQTIAEDLAESQVIYRGRDAYVRIVPAVDSSYDVA